GARHEVHLQPKPQRGRADEVAVAIQIVTRLPRPERMAPQLERPPKPVDVLGAAELLDARLPSSGHVAVDVVVRERAVLGLTLVTVLAQMHVVVRQHGAGTLTGAVSDGVRRTLVDLAIMLGSFAVASAVAAALGAANFGTALAFGQMGFAIALMWVLLRRP